MCVCVHSSAIKKFGGPSSTTMFFRQATCCSVWGQSAPQSCWWCTSVRPTRSATMDPLDAAVTSASPGSTSAMFCLWFWHLVTVTVWLLRKIGAEKRCCKPFVILPLITILCPTKRSRLCLWSPSESKVSGVITRFRRRQWATVLPIYAVCPSRLQPSYLRFIHGVLVLYVSTGSRTWMPCVVFSSSASTWKMMRNGICRSSCSSQRELDIISSRHIPNLDSVTACQNGLHTSAKAAILTISHNQWKQSLIPILYMFYIYICSIYI